ncbi:hypothetical protein ACFL6I_01740 [candidate division KSB1 bacterium]
MEQHVKIVAILHIVFGSIFIFFALIVFVAVTGGGLLSGDSEAIFITAIVGTAVASFLVLISAPGIIAGIGLLYWKEWARILGVVLGILNLVNFPIGTFLGIYALWTLLNKETVEIFNKHRT